MSAKETKASVFSSVMCSCFGKRLLRRFQLITPASCVRFTHPTPVNPLLLLSGLAECGEQLVSRRRSRHRQPLQAGRPEEQSPQLPHQLPGEYLRQGASHICRDTPPFSLCVPTPSPHPSKKRKKETKVPQVFSTRLPPALSHVCRFSRTFALRENCRSWESDLLIQGSPTPCMTAAALDV